MTYQYAKEKVAHKIVSDGCWVLYWVLYEYLCQWWVLGIMLSVVWIPLLVVGVALRSYWRRRESTIFRFSKFEPKPGIKIISKSKRDIFSEKRLKQYFPQGFSHKDLNSMGLDIFWKLYRTKIGLCSVELFLKYLKHF